MYTEIKPTPECGFPVEAFWTYSNIGKEDQVTKILPDTCADIIVDTNKGEGFLSGVMCKAQSVSLRADAELLGIRFKAEHISFLINLPLSETKNRRIDLNDVLPQDFTKNLKNLAALNEPSQKVQFIQSLLSVQWKDKAQSKDRLVHFLAQHIRNMKGAVKIREIGESSGYSLRNVERRFKSQVGLSLKEFSALVRFNTAKKRIRNASQESLTGIAYEMGYYDHSHMNRDFKRFTEESPSFFN